MIKRMNFNQVLRKCGNFIVRIILRPKDPWRKKRYASFFYEHLKRFSMNTGPILITYNCTTKTFVNSIMKFSVLFRIMNTENNKAINWKRDYTLPCDSINDFLLF